MRNNNKAVKTGVKGRAGIKPLIPFLGLLAAVVFFQASSGGRLLRTDNISIFVSQAFAIVIAACGGVFLMAQGNIDFSMAGNVCVCAAVIAKTSQTSILLAVLVGLLLGSLLGCANGLIHAVLGMPSFVATLAMNFMFIGIANVMLGAGSIAADYSMKILDTLPLRLLVLGVVLLLTFLVLEYSPFGKQCKAIGARLEVARQSGINIFFRKMTPFLISGFSCGIIASFSILRTCTASTTTGANTHINMILALLLGGVPFSGGWATRFRSVLVGSLLMAVVSNGLIIMGVDVISQQLIKGILFVAAVAISFDRKNATVIK